MPVWGSTPPLLPGLGVRVGKKFLCCCLLVDPSGLPGLASAMCISSLSSAGNLDTIVSGCDLNAPLDM